MKICYVCKLELDESNFHKNQKRCKGCMKAYQQANKDRIKEQRILYQKENYERLAAVKAAYYYKNQERWRQHAREKYAEDADNRRQSSRQYREAHPDKARQAKLIPNRAYKARKRAASGSFTTGEIKRLLDLQKHRCPVCKIRLDKFHIDHVMPLSKGGVNDVSNLQLLCPTCNLKKHAKHPIDFMQDNGFLL